jgi:hypothetical protein
METGKNGTFLDIVTTREMGQSLCEPSLISKQLKRRIQAQRHMVRKIEVKPKESDWKTFRKIVPELRERYLTEKNKEIVAIFMDEGRTPTERFWDARERE